MRSILALIILYLDVSIAQFRFGDPLTSYDPPFKRAAAVRSDGDPGYRLPQFLDPIHYVVELTPNFDEKEYETFSFNGVVIIVVQALEEGIKEIVFHEKVNDVLGVGVIDAKGQSVNLNSKQPFERIRKYEFLKIKLDDGQTLTKDDFYNVTVYYNAFVSEDPRSSGLFKGRYLDHTGNYRWYVSNCFEGTYTRRAFPSFDEPGFKSTFDIIVNRPVTYASTYSNMKFADEIPFGDRVKEIFHTTPRMSAYLVSLHISKDFRAIADNDNATHPFRVIARPNAIGQGDYALRTGPQVLSWLVDYLGIDSYTMGDNINEDHVAMPEIFTNAIENWGSIHYREDNLLYDEEENSVATKELVAQVMTHEILHKWFGNLVTCNQWDSVWINEGFPTYLERLAMHEIDQSFQSLDKQSMILQRALWFDSESSTTAMEHPVYAPEEIDESFNGIAYLRSGSFLLMLRHYISEEAFKNGLNIFLIDNAYENVQSKDVYKAFSTAFKDLRRDTAEPDFFEELMKLWTEQPGYPMISAIRDPNTGVISLEQQRFFINATAVPTDQVWMIPLTFTTGDNPNWENLDPSHLMSEKTMEIQGNPGDHWVIFNLQQKGLYRVMYDKRNWQLIARTLREQPNIIHHLNRAQIVDDVMAFMMSKKMTFDTGFQILDFLKQETNFFVWNSAIRGFQLIRNRYFHLTYAELTFDPLLHQYLDTVINNLGYDVEQNETHLRTENRMNIMKFACSVGHKGCSDDAAAKFQDFKTTGTKVNPNLRTHVYCKGIQMGDYSDWNFLHGLWKTSNNAAAQYEMLFALGCTTHEQAVHEYLNTIMKLERGKIYSFDYYLLHPIKIDRLNGIKVLQFFKENINDIRNLLYVDAPLDMVLGQLADTLNDEELDDMEQWLTDNRATIPESEESLKSIASARKRLQEGYPEADEIIAAASKKSKSQEVSSLTTMLDDVLSKGVTLLSKIYQQLETW